VQPLWLRDAVKTCSQLVTLSLLPTDFHHSVSVRPSSKCVTVIAKISDYLVVDMLLHYLVKYFAPSQCPLVRFCITPLL